MSSLLVAWTSLALALPAGGASVADPGSVTGLQILPAAGQTEVVIALEGTVETRDFTMEGPHRIVVDLMGAELTLAADMLEGAGRGGLQQLRASQYSEDVVRIVLELAEPLDYQLFSGEGYVRISMVNTWGDFEAFEVAAADTAPPLAAQPVGTGPTTPNVLFEASNPPAPVLAAQDLADRITVSFANTPIRDVLFTFSEFADRSIVPGAQVEGVVNAEIRDQPWDIALQAILHAHELAAEEAASGIIRVERLEDIADREEVEPLVTRAFRVDFAQATELQSSVETLLSERGQVSVSQSTNSLVVTDVPRVLNAVEELVTGLDLESPEITISAEIIFVDRTDLEEFGVVYDLKDSRGNQLNAITPGAVDSDGDGLISEDEQVDIGTNVISLGGSSIAALGNANSRVVNPSLQFLTSLIIGRHTLVSFVEALESVNLSDVQAAPQITVLDNNQARILVGERTPIRVIDAAGGGQGGGGGGGFAQASVQIEETGIILEVTPHVTAGDLILMQLRAERSGLQLLDSDLGVNFNTQEAETRVLVQDGETVVIGGLTVTERTETRAGIPLLQNLPLLGRFFQVTREETNQRDLMILVTPEINRR